MFKKCLNLCLPMLLCAGIVWGSDDIILKPGFQIYIEKDAPAPLQNAMAILQRDLKNVLGQESVITHNWADLNICNSVVIVTEALSSKALNVQRLEGFEAHKLFTDKGRLVLQGADLRGTLFAVFTFSEKCLGIKPLWYWASLKPQQNDRIKIPEDFMYFAPSPDVKYRAWFPNDMDMFTGWRQQSDENNGIWLETMLRLKLNTVNWNDKLFGDPYAISDDFKLIKHYGLYVTFHHHNPMNACFSGWKDYWTQCRKQTPPELLLANEQFIKEYWRYCVRTLVKNDIDVIWVINFRGNTDGPYWDTFKDAPETMQQRADVINRLVRDQVEIIRQETGDPKPPVRMIFYNELSDLLAAGLLKPPVGENMIWTFVAARRDHFPNFDIQTVSIPQKVSLGYYMNFQFTSTGSHLAAAEGPWKMEANYRYLKSKGLLEFSEVNAGNIREHVVELAANAAMLWRINNYETDGFLLNFCNEYFGKEYGKEIAALYKSFYYSYWNQKRSDLPGFDRQYIFQDLRYPKAIGQLTKIFFEPYDPNPLKDMGNEQLKNRTFQIVPQDNGTDSQVDAIIRGTQESAQKFTEVSKKADRLYARLDASSRVFFNDNLRVQARFMLNLNKAMYNFCLAYKDRESTKQRQYLSEAYNYVDLSQKVLGESAHDGFSAWYETERIFGFKRLLKEIGDLAETLKPGAADQDRSLRLPD